MKMKKNILFFTCCVAVVFSALMLYAAPPGSNRQQVVQDNFHQLIKENSCPGCDLAGVVLTRVNLAGVNLEGANLAGAKFYLADLSAANLKGANLQGAAFGGADLAGADLTGANLTGAILGGAYLKGAITDGIITDSFSGESGITPGETTFIADESQSKHAPYSQEVVIEERPDVVDVQPVEELAVGDNAELSKQITDAPISPALAQSKQPVLMADAVVSVPDATDPGSGKLQSKEAAQVQVEVADAVILQEQNKRKVTAQHEHKEIIQETEETAATAIESDEDAAEKTGVTRDELQVMEEVVVAEDVKVTETVAEGAVVHDGIEPIKENGSVASPPDESENAAATTEAERVVKLDDSVTKEQKAESQFVPEAVEPEDIELQSQTKGEAPVAEEDSLDRNGDEAALSVSDLVADIEEDTPSAQAPVDDLVYSVETPEQAAARQLALVELLLDDDRCVECDLSGVDLSGKRMKEVDLERANLQGANLEDANLSEANLKGANLSGANLRDADLSEADLYSANLSGADLTGADLTDTLLDSADLTGAVGVPPVDTTEVDE
jgi:uncharacterized protein YjbI with pentapeptide repeats